MTELEKLRAKMAKAEAEAALKDRIIAAVPHGHRHVHVHDLYGSVAVVKYGDNLTQRIVGQYVGDKYEYVPNPDGPVSWQRAVEIVRALPPVAIVKVRDGCLSFRPAEHFAGLPEEKRSRAKVTEVCPVKIGLSCAPTVGPGAALEWYTKLPDIGLVEVNVELGEPPRGVLEYRVSRKPAPRGWEHKADFDKPTVNVYCDTISRDNVVVARALPTVRWWSSDDYPAACSVVFQPVGDPREPAEVGRLIVEYIAGLVRESVK